MRTAQDRRRLKRYVERLDAHFQSGKIRGCGLVRNLSKEGLFIRSELLPEPGAPIALTLETVSGDKIDLNGTVRWTTAQVPEPQEDMKSGFGVRIEVTGGAYRDLFEALLLT